MRKQRMSCEINLCADGGSARRVAAAAGHDGRLCTVVRIVRLRLTSHCSWSIPSYRLWSRR